MINIKSVLPFIFEPIAIDIIGENNKRKFAVKLIGGFVLTALLTAFSKKIFCAMRKYIAAAVCCASLGAAVVLIRKKLTPHSK